MIGFLLHRVDFPCFSQVSVEDRYEFYCLKMGPKALDYESINENVKKVQYAVRGELYLRASELQKQGKKVSHANHLSILIFLQISPNPYDIESDPLFSLLQFPDYLYKCWEPSRSWAKALNLSSSGSLQFSSSVLIFTLTLIKTTQVVRLLLYAKPRFF